MLMVVILNLHDADHLSTSCVIVDALAVCKMCSSHYHKHGRMRVEC